MTTTLTALGLVLIPGIVTAITGAVKMMPTFAYVSDSSRKPLVRLIAALISFVVVLLSQWTTGGFNTDVISASLQTLIFTAGTWFASLGIFHGVFQR